VSPLARRIAALGALTVATAAVLGWMYGEDASEPAVSARAAIKFVPATPHQSTVPQDLAILAQRQPWGVTKQEPAQGQDQSQAQAAASKTQGQAVQGEGAIGHWRVGGILKLGEESFVILMIQPQPNAPNFVKYLGVGTALPDGRVIEGITGDSVLLRQGDQQAVLRLYLPGAG
jgi:hypothetical protein